MGADIDAGFDLVARFNNAPTKRHERDVGSFTTLRYTNNFYERYREAPGEADNDGEGEGRSGEGGGGPGSINAHRGVSSER